MHSSLQLRTCTSTEEYGLSKDVGYVVVARLYGAYHQRPILRESNGFVTMDANLHKEYEEYQATNAVCIVSFLPQNELQQIWCRTQKLSSTQMVEKYGRN